MKVGDICLPMTITVRGMLATSSVRAWRLGDWAAHQQISNPELYALTLLPIGLSLPFVWASFASLGAAVGAMRDIARLRNSWGVVTQADFTRSLRDQLMEICQRHGAIEGPIQMVADCDRGSLGVLPGARLNGYAATEVC
jgi:hypothetical protein